MSLIQSNMVGEKMMLRQHILWTFELVRFEIGDIKIEHLDKSHAPTSSM